MFSLAAGVLALGAALGMLSGANRPELDFLNHRS